ncbi:CGNR zinc finger domain-containing protein [Actinocrinis puniceicyclus]|uniref:CGNR zinc finger domain-containing protein n=1 Tax=Actinocrinis puniceicyclus TaxID=977794 RepID=A0A8J7WMP9_9ACTN|nr:CGNR zinc finger domain-containing protein [Actinocrinis puniceicyclus]MBS2962254.1 CGNR zinc finger domain-containing protein [Actinocrinis puniceicyclus]
MDFGSHTVDVVDLAVSLVNAVVPGRSRGRVFAAANDIAELRQRVRSVSGLAPDGQELTDAEARGMARVAQELRAVFEAAGEGKVDEAARLLNAMAVHYDARPMLLRHDDGPWHLHFHGPRAGLVESAGGSLAVALAYVLGSDYADRIGICSAPSCDRVYVDVSRNGTKRFCSTACQNRVKAANFRARQAATAARPECDRERIGDIEG